MCNDIELSTVGFSDLPKECFISDASRRMNGTVTFPKHKERELKNIRLNVHACKEPERLTDVEICLASIPSYLSMALSNPQQKIQFGRGCHGHWVLRLWGPSCVVIGDNTTSNGVECFLNDGGRLVIGDDCMFASHISLHVGDNHAIFDIESGQVLNYSERPFIEFGAHVWVATRGIVLADTVIGDGSVIGAGSVVKGIFSPHSLIAGAPAKVVKEGVSWTRDYWGCGAKEVIDKLKARQLPSHRGEGSPRG
jgi:acetyltransferase-like isoleucine patch superfamily enzyme